MTATEAWDRLLAIPYEERTHMEKLLCIACAAFVTPEYYNGALIEYWRMVDELAELKAKQ